MSVLFDLLSKLERKGKRSGVYPGIFRGKGGSQPRNRLIFLLVGLVALSLLLAGAYFYLINSSASVSYNPPQVAKRQEVNVSVPESVRVKEDVNAISEESAGIEKLLVEEEEEKTPAKQVFQKPKRKDVPKEDASKLAYEAFELFKKGRLRESAELYERSLRVKYNPKVANNLVVVYVLLGEFERAERVIERFESDRLVYSYVVELVKAGKEERAFEAVRRFSYLDRKGYVSFARGYLEERRGNIEGAVKSYREAFEKNSGNPYFGYNYGRLLELKGNLGEALRVYSFLVNNSGLSADLKSVLVRRISYLSSLGVKVEE